MRVFRSFPEAESELRRDLAEMGTRVHTQTYQDKEIGNDPQMETMELQNYQYCVLDASHFHKELLGLGIHEEWVWAEWGERLRGIQGGKVGNPGEAYQKRPEVWDQFLETDGGFSYTYPERLWPGVHHAIQRLQEDIYTRQAYITVWQSKDSGRALKKRRVPCTLGYLVQFRNGKLNITYLQRSADLVTHFRHDQYLCCKVLEYISQQLGHPMGSFTHWVGSLHAFKRDLSGIF